MELADNDPIEGLIVETDVGLDELPVLRSSGTSTGCDERFLILRFLGANTRVLEDVISSSGKDKDLKTEQVARWIQGLLALGPHPTPGP